MPFQRSSASNDAALLAAISRGDESAFLRLYERASGPLFSLIHRVLQHQQDAEEVLQQTFLQVWRKAGSFDESRCAPFTWLVTIARSKAIDRLRQRNGQQKLAENAAREEAPAPIAQVSGADDVASQETRAAVNAALETIPADQRQAIEMAFFGGMTQTEISEALAEPLGTVKARIRRGMLRLREHLRRRV